MANAYLEILREHLLETEIIIIKGIMSIEDVVYTKDDGVFSDIIIDSDFINKKYFENSEHSVEEIYKMLKEYCQDFLKDKKQVIKIKRQQKKNKR